MLSTNSSCDILSDVFLLKSPSGDDLIKLELSNINKMFELRNGNFFFFFQSFIHKIYPLTFEDILRVRATSYNIIHIYKNV